MKTFVITIFTLLAISNAGATEPENTSVLESPATPRSSFNYFASANYAFVDIPILSKYGGTVGLISNPDQTWELEYMKGSVGSSILLSDIANVSDTKISLIGRTYFGGSFHLSYGISYFDFSMTLGDEFMNSVNGNYPSADVLKIQGWGIAAGFGNTWTIRKNINIGIDWMCLAQPLLITTKDADYLKDSSDPDDRDKVQTAVDILSYLPRLSLIQVHVGMMF
ncbi:hypothetical protein [Bdellovibrio sp. HCB2-146]|uniref:hypothetical protein n=1 Tax=Bdellovibrio sp. HCB2-146 TaxID=3394362 RepID=UPI0039BC7137